MHEEELQRIGLSEKEAKVYLSALTLGKATAQEVAKKADLKRPTTYFTMEGLMKKGLMSSVHEGKKQYFMAENPERLADVFEARQAELKRQGERLKDVIPDLKKMQPKTDEGPVVKYYTGKEGALSMVKDLLSYVDSEQVWIAYPSDTVENVFTQGELESIRFTRQSQTTRLNALYTSEKKTLPNSDRVVRTKIDGKELPLSADIAVYGDKVRMASFENEIVGVVVENREIAETFKTLFKLAWEAAQKHKVK